MTTLLSRKKMSSIILIAMVLGMVLGSRLTIWPDALVTLGKSIIQLIKIAAAPYLFFMVILSVLNTELNWRMGKRVITVAVINSYIALIIGLLFSNIFQPGLHFQVFSNNMHDTINEGGGTFSLSGFIQQFAPRSLLDPFLKNDILFLAVFALVLGLIIKKVRAEAYGHSRADERSSFTLIKKTLERFLSMIIALVPLAVFAAIGSSIHQYGFAPMRALFMYLVVALGGLTLHAVLVYGFWIIKYSRIPLRDFWNASKDALTYAFSVNSSLATLPLTLKSLDTLKISPSASALGAGIATNLNNDGVIRSNGSPVPSPSQWNSFELWPTIHGLRNFLTGGHGNRRHPGGWLYFALDCCHCRRNPH